MSTSIKFEWFDAGFKEILADEAVKDLVRGGAEEIAAVAGEGFEAEPRMTSRLRVNREIYVVQPVTAEARRAEATDKRLEKAVEQCRVR